MKEKKAWRGLTCRLFCVRDSQRVALPERRWREKKGARGWTVDGLNNGSIEAINK